MLDPVKYYYFYGDEAMQFSFFRIPRQLITHPHFKQVSTAAKLLYGMLLDRMGLSIKNEWYNDDGRVYIYYTIKEICDNLDREAGKRFDELISCHNTIVNTISYENFRTGFQLGVMMVMEAVNENDATFFEL